jgi:hypothetical protein
MTTRTLRNHVHEFTFTQHGDQMCVGPCLNCGAVLLDDLTADGWTVGDSEEDDGLE